MGVFRGVAITKQQVSSSAGGPIPVEMPADVAAGDYLVAVFGNYEYNVTGFSPPPSGWELQCQSPDIFLKVADGTEGGSTVVFTTQNTSGFAGATRVSICAVLCYRFPVAPDAITVDDLRFLGGGPIVDSADCTPGGPYPGASMSPYEVRVLAMVGAAATGEDVFPLEGADWYGVTADRTGAQSLAADAEATQDDSTLTVADVINVASGTDPDTGIVIRGGEGCNGILHGIRFAFGCPAEQPIHVGTCPTYVAFYSAGNEGYFGGSVTMPAYEPGMLLLMVACSADDGVSLGPPSGWNTLFNEQWGETPLHPTPTPNPSPADFFFTPHSNGAVFWKIADGSEPAEGEEVWSLDFGNGTEGAQVFSYACYEMCSDDRVPFPDPPIKYAGMNHVLPEFDPDPDRHTDAGAGQTAYWGTSVSYPTPTADWIGNHVYFAMAQLKGNALMWYSAETPPSNYAWTGLNAEDTLPPSAKQVGEGGSDYAMIRVIPDGSPGSSPLGGQGLTGWQFIPDDGAGIWLWSSGDNVFWDINVNDNYLPSGAAALSKMTDSYDLGHQEVWAISSVYNDGAIGTLHVDYEDWSVKFGLAARSFVIQAPESFFPPNDTPETAYPIGDCCPIEIHQCIFAARSEGGSQVEGVDPNYDVWFSFVASASTISFDTVGSDYFTVVAIYDADMNLISSNKDIPPNTGAQTTAATSIGSTYYVQVISWDTIPDQTCLELSIVCAEDVAYWGILAVPL